MDKPITDGMHAFLSPISEGGHSGIFSRDAVDLIYEVMLADLATRRDGSGRFRPSMLGDICLRRQMLSYHGAPQTEPDMALQMLFNEGTWKHYYWQAAGLTVGFLSRVEVPMFRDGVKWGQADGVQPDGSLFELKAVRDTVFRKVVLDNHKPKGDHMMQSVAMANNIGADEISLVYTDRNTGGFHEFRFDRDYPWFKVAEKELERREEILHHHRDEETMPGMLPDCARGRGDEYKECRFREACTSWGLHGSLTDAVLAAEAADE